MILHRKLFEVTLQLGVADPSFFAVFLAHPMLVEITTRRPTDDKPDVIEQAI